MQGLFRLITGVFKLTPFALGAISCAIFTLGVYLQRLENDTNALKADMLLAGPPAAVSVSAMKAAAEAHPFDEVVVQAQLDFSMEYELILTGGDADRSGYMIPLLAAEADLPAELPEVVGILLFDDKDLTPEAIGAIDFGPRVETEGPFGPILMLNGMVGDMGDFETAIAEVFALQERALPPGTPVLRSFEGNRAGAYTPDWPFETSIFAVFSWIGGGFGLFALLRLAIRNRPQKTARQKPVSTPDDLGGPISSTS